MRFAARGMVKLPVVEKAYRQPDVFFERVDSIQII
jgi:hypothetical protein